MKVTTVSATIRFSEDSGKGAWKSLELGAEAVIEPQEDWEEVQARLYARLTNQFKGLWNKNSVSKANYQESMPLEALSAEPEHFCQEHNCEFKKFTKNNKVWYAHPMGDTKWCNE